MRLVTILMLGGALAAPLGAQRTLPVAGTPRTPASPTGAPPVALAISGTPSTSALTWQWPAGATGFDVYRMTAASGAWTKLNAAPVAVTSFADASGFRFGDAYTYRVVALYNDGSFGSAELPFQPPAPANPSWVKATQQGASVTVSWAAVPGAARYVVAGLTAAEGREVVAPATSVTYQNVAAGAYRWIVGARFDPGPIETPANLWTLATLTISPASARYRVLVTGVSVQRKTADDPLHKDGMDDEIFVAAQSLVLDRQSGALMSKQVSRSQSYGDAYNPPRIQAGTASNHGGILNGDRIPSADPTYPAGPVTTTMLPLIAFDGTLTDGREEVLLFPSVWEVDHGNGTVYNQWLTDVPQMRASQVIAPYAAKGSPFPVYSATSDIRYQAQEGWDWQDEIRLDRPVGSYRGQAVSGIGNINTYHYLPRVLRLTREDLERALATPFVASNGAKGVAFPIQLREEDGYLWGDYLLHLWIERIP